MKLAELGYYTGTVTGTYLSGTQNAVKAFQRANGIYADGKAGERTLTLLYAPVLTSPTPVPTDTRAAAHPHLYPRAYSQPHAFHHPSARAHRRRLRRTPCCPMPRCKIANLFTAAMQQNVSPRRLVTDNAMRACAAHPCLRGRYRRRLRKTDATPRCRNFHAAPLHGGALAKAALVAGVTDVAIDTPKPQRYNEKCGDVSVASP